jgi:hypothetical protein
MRTLASAIDGRWVFSPYRESVPQNITSTEIEFRCKSERTGFLNIYNDGNTIQLSQSVEAGFDFAKKYVKEFKEDNSLYIQQIADNRTDEAEFAVVLVINGKIQRDAILNLTELTIELTHLQESVDNHFIEKMIVREYAALSSIAEGVIEKIALSKDAITSLASPLTVTLTPSLDVELSLTRLALKNIKRKPLKSANLLVIGLASILMLVYVFQSPDAERFTVYNDPYLKFKETLTKGQPAVGNRMAQAFNIHTAVEKMPGWKLVKVIHSKTQSVQFYVTKSLGGSDRQLKLFAKANGLIVMQEKSGSVLTTTGANVPPISGENNLRVSKIADVYQFISDAVISMIPDANLYMLDYRKLDTTQNEWTTMRAAIDFKVSTKEDLLKIRSITKELPVTLEAGSYQVSDGQFSGSIIIQIHGVEI